MARSSGVYTPPAGQPVVTDTSISSSVFNALVADVGAEITNSLPRDGSAPPTANLPMGGYRMTGMGDGVAAQDSATINQTVTALAAPTGSSLVGHIATGTGAVARTVQSKLRDVVSVKDFGAVGDGVTDDTDALNNAFISANGKVLILGENKTYRYNTTTGLSISNPITIISNFSKFRELTANTAFKFNIISDNVVIDSLSVEFVGASNAQFNERGINIEGSNITIGTIEVAGDNSQTGANAGAYNAVVIGSATVEKTSIKIGSIKTTNWDRPIVLKNLTNWSIGHISCTTYRRAVYVSDCKSGEILGGNCSVISPTSTGSAGENGILIESTTADFSTRDIRISNFTVENSGEHGYRIGGDTYAVSGIWYNSCSAVSSGSGVGTGVEPDDHGGCGFKVLGASPTGLVRHQNINYLNCTVKNIVLDNLGLNVNFAGFQLGKTVNITLTNCSVSPTLSTASYGTPATYSCINGIEIIGCENVTITNPMIYYPRYSGIYIYDSNQLGYDWGQTTDIKIIGGVVHNPVEACVEVTAAYTTMRRISVSGLLSDGGMYALRSTVSGSGVLIGCTFNGEVWNQTIANIVDSSNWMVGLQGQYVGTNLVNLCRKGSWFSDWGNGEFKIKDDYAWSNAPTSFQVTLAASTAMSFTPRRGNGHYFITCSGSAYYGHAWMRTTSGAASVKISGGANFAVLNIALTGTSGTSLNVTLGTDGTKIYLENYTASSQTFTVTQLG